LNSFLSMNNLMDISNRTESGKNNNKETGKLENSEQILKSNCYFLLFRYHNS
jgi:hypothetical protein